ncbi:MAG: Uncharacterized protein G01um101493_329 [Microgenomates group bacterium Gr01-1014_93]|nr:MAG: Uncharacterized protein G01um101493_329 [Microgenomates group bacterium Gr01-1014_93]
MLCQPRSCKLNVVKRRALWYIGKVRSFPHFQLFLILIFASLLIFFLDSVHFLSLPKTALSFVTTPIQYGLYSSGQRIGKQFYFIFAARFAAKENKALKEQLAQLLSENAKLRRNLSETQSLVEQQETLDPRVYNLVSARPIGLDRYLKIDKGFKDGIRQSQAVIFKDNFLGRIITVSEKSANVMLSEDPDSKLSAFSINKAGKAKGILSGNFGSEILFEKILHEEPIEAGDLVYSEGTEGFLPRGLVLGRVSEVLSKETQVFKSAKIMSVFDLRDLELVFIIKEGKL